MAVNAEAGEVKKRANELFAQGSWQAAKSEYTRAIEANDYCPWAVALCNRAACELRLEEEGAALSDATSAISLDPSYTKGYYRRASASIQLGRFKAALKDIQHVVHAHPFDSSARKKEKECRLAVQRMRFEQAIAREDGEATADGSSAASDSAGPDAAEVDPDSVAVEAEYDGPVLEGENEDVISQQFVHSMLEHFRNERRLHRKYALRIVHQARDVFQQESSVVDVPIGKDSGGSGHLTICGDVHGQYYDLLNIFHLNGMPSPENPYIFNGDFVDRGSFSVEVILTLLAIKVLYPQSLTLIRGNHETKSMNRIYGFDGEVKHKYNGAMAQLFAQTFCALPIAALVGERVLVLHGGLFSRDDVSLGEIRMLDRHREPPEAGLLCEALWSDPQPANGRSPSKRGVGVAFGPDVTSTFLQYNDLDYIVRSHEVKDAGYEVAHDSRCITVFSGTLARLTLLFLSFLTRNGANLPSCPSCVRNAAPNYCDQMGNKGAYIVLREDLVPAFHTFSAVPHPNVKPMAYGSPLLGMM
jgi:serine/threonine-protein phosphatase 5